MELLKLLGYEVVYSAASNVPAWGKHVIHAKHSNGATVHGYGENETDALANALETISKRIK